MSNLCTCHIDSNSCTYCEHRDEIEEYLALRAKRIQQKKDERYGKWTKETVWIYRNDRGDIMRAQDEHPAAASEEVEEG